mgnify:CR=1 FL=1
MIADHVRELIDAAARQAASKTTCKHHPNHADIFVDRVFPRGRLISGRLLRILRNSIGLEQTRADRDSAGGCEKGCLE